MSFKIHLREYPLEVGIGPYILFGQKVSHTYLALEEDDTTIEEIHGVSYNPRTGEIEDCATGLDQVFNILAHDLGGKKFFNEDKHDFPMLTIQFNKDEVSIFEESFKLVSSYDRDVWTECEEVARDIAERNLEYMAIKGQNCHAVSSTICKSVLDIDISGMTKYKAPGIQKNL